MSIDALIQAHIEALNTNTKAVELLTLSLAGRTPKAEDKPAKVKKDTVEQIVEDLKPVVEPDENCDAPEDEAPGSTAVPYETLRALVLKLASGGKREEIKTVNAKHGIGNAKELLSNPDDMSTIKDQEKLNAYYADLQALEG